MPIPNKGIYSDRSPDDLNNKQSKQTNKQSNNNNKMMSLYSNNPTQFMRLSAESIKSNCDPK